MINFDFKNVIEFVETFKSEQDCINHLEELRWNGLVISPFYCTSIVYKCKGNRYRCKNTGKYFNVKTGTMFENTKIPLLKWFYAIHQACLNPSISSYKLSERIGVSQRSCSYMINKMKGVGIII